MTADWHPSPSHPEATGSYIVTYSDGRVTTATWRKAWKDMLTDEIRPGTWILKGGKRVNTGISVTAWTEWPEAYKEKRHGMAIRQTG